MTKAIKNTVLYSVGNLITALSAFILLPIYTRYISVEEFGIVSSMQTLSAILVIIISLALERSVFRIYYDYQTEDEKKQFLGTIFIGLLIIGITSVIVLFAFKKYLNQLFPLVPFSPYYSYTILYAFLLSIINFSQIILQVKQNAKGFIFISLLLFFVTAFINLYLIIYKHEGAAGIIIGTLLGAIIVTLLTLYNIAEAINLTFQKAKFKEAIKFSLPMLPTLLSSWVLNVSDRVFIAHYYTQTDVGIYSLAYRISSLILLAANALFMAYNPIFYQIANDGNLSDKEKDIKIYRYNKIVTVAIGFLGILLLLASDIGVKLFFKREFYSAYSFIPIFVLAFMINQVAGLINLMLYQAKKTWQVTCAVFVSALLNVVLNYFFIPRCGVYFAVISTILCNMCSFLILLYFAKRGYYVKLDWLSLFGILFFSLFAIAENYFLTNVDIIVAILVKLATAGLLFFLFKNFIYQLLTLIKRKQI